MVNGVLRIPYDTTKGRKYREFYHDGFKKHSDGYDNVADVMPSYRKYDSRHTIVNRIKAGVCEICGEHADYLCMHHVRTLKSLKGRDIFEQKMLKMRENLWLSALTALNSYTKPKNQGDSWKPDTLRGVRPVWEAAP